MSHKSGKQVRRLRKKCSFDGLGRGDRIRRGLAHATSTRSPRDEAAKLPPSREKARSPKAKRHDG